MQGEGCEQFVQQINCGGKVLLVFNMTGPKPSISVAYGKFQMEVGSDADSSDYYFDDSSDYNSDASHIVAQRVHLNKHENDRVIAFTGHKILCWCSFCDSFDDHKFEET